MQMEGEKVGRQQERRMRRLTMAPLLGKRNGSSTEAHAKSEETANILRRMFTRAQQTHT